MVPQKRSLIEIAVFKSFKASRLKKGSLCLRDPFLCRNNLPQSSIRMKTLAITPQLKLFLLYG